MKHHNNSNQKASSIHVEEGNDKDIRESFVNGKKFCVDHSKNGRAKCRKCKKVIPVGVLRIGKNVQFKQQYILHYYHVNCIFESFKHSRYAANVITDLGEIAGVSKITEEEQATISNLIENLDQKNLRIEKTQLSATVTTKSTKIDRNKLKPYSGSSTKILFTNGDQMNAAKYSELQQLIDREKPLIVAICEVKPKNPVKERTDADFQIPDYELHPVNLRNSDPGRGVAVFTHSAISKSVTQVKLDVKFEEACLLEIRLRGGDTLIFACCYRSPTTTASSELNNTNLNLLLKNIHSRKYTHRCIIGDFNFRAIDWSSWTTSEGSESKEAKFIDTVKDCFYHQHIDKPTRRRGNDMPSQLDLIFTDEEMQVSDVQHLAPLGKSDHSVILFNFCSYVDYSKPKDTYNYEKGDYEGMTRELVSSAWCDDYVNGARNRTVEENWLLLKNKLIDLRNRFVPLRKGSSKRRWKKSRIPINDETKDAIKSKKKAHRQWITANPGEESDSRKTMYKKATSKVKKLLQKAKRLFEKGIALEAKTNPKKFWLHARSKLNTKTGIAPLLENQTDQTSLRYDDKSKADLLQKQFLSVFTKESADDVPKLATRTISIISELLIMEKDVLTKLKCLNPYKSCGPDGIHSRLLRELADHMAGPVTALFNSTLRHGQVPHDWRKANISAIFKKGSKNLASNYRPISLTAVLCKLMESFLRDHMMKHLIDNNLLTKKQHGFISGRSTVTQLLNYLDKCAQSVATGKVVDAIYLDFEKAFDTVPHRRLLGKLESYGISGGVLKWVADYLSGRTQVVSVNGTVSDVGSVLSGVPQGTVLGPLLFVIYINDMLDPITSDGLLFADDTKVFRQICSEENALQLQSDINKLEAWTKTWLLRFNADKCHVLTLGRFENIRHTHRYKIGGRELEHVFEEKDLGVHVDSDLSFEEHITTKVRKANQIMGLIRRSFTYLDEKSFVRLYTALVRPHLEYAQSVWSPHLKKFTNLIENVQIRATKLVDHLDGLDYSERLKRLNLPTLAFRRLRGDLVEMYKHFAKYDKDILPDSFQPKERINRRHRFQIHERAAKDGVRGIQRNSFYYRVAKEWNNLPSTVVEAPSVDAFKNRLDEVMKDNALKFDHNARAIESDS